MRVPALCAASLWLSVIGAGTAVADEAKVAALTEAYDAKLAHVDIIREIGGMLTADQYVRFTLSDIIKAEQMTGEERKAFEKAAGERVDALDAAHTARLKELLQQTTWTELADMKPDVASDAWTLVQHSGDLEFMKDTLAKVEPLVREGKMHGSAYANMYDRVARMEGKPQYYGTQSRCVDGQFEPSEIDSPETLDTRRQELGLQPLDDYFKTLREMYGPC